MASNVQGPIYPGPAYNGNSLITAQVTTITSSATTVTGFVPGSVGMVQLVTFDVQGDDIRCFWEGSTPTSTSGHILPGGTAYTWQANQYNGAKFILSSGSTAATI